VGNLNRPTVIEAVRRFGWHPLPDSPRGEDDVFELWVLPDLARGRGAVRRSGRWLVATRAGRALAGDPEVLWYAVAHRLDSGHDFAATVTELALLLVEAGEVAEATLVERVGAGAVGEGWHEQASGQPPDPKAVRGQLAAPLRLLEVLGLRRSGEDWRSRWVALPSRAGRALEALRARATGPGRPARPMTSATSGGDGEPGSAAPPARRRLMFGPEPWRELAGGTWSHWDLWFCTVTVTGFDGDWAGSATRSCGAAHRPAATPPPSLRSPVGGVTKRLASWS
jgi:hypothetical protein